MELLQAQAEHEEQLKAELDVGVIHAGPHQVPAIQWEEEQGKPLVNHLLESDTVFLTWWAGLSETEQIRVGGYFGVIQTGGLVELLRRIFVQQTKSDPDDFERTIPLATYHLLACTVAHRNNWFAHKEGKAPFCYHHGKTPWSFWIQWAILGAYRRGKGIALDQVQDIFGAYVGTVSRPTSGSPSEFFGGPRPREKGKKKDEEPPFTSPIRTAGLIQLPEGGEWFPAMQQQDSRFRGTFLEYVATGHVRWGTTGGGLEEYEACVPIQMAVQNEFYETVMSGSAAGVAEKFVLSELKIRSKAERIKRQKDKPSRGLSYSADEIALEVVTTYLRYLRREFHPQSCSVDKPADWVIRQESKRPSLLITDDFEQRDVAVTMGYYLSKAPFPLPSHVELPDPSHEPELEECLLMEASVRSSKKLTQADQRRLESIRLLADGSIESLVGTPKEPKAFSREEMEAKLTAEMGIPPESGHNLFWGRYERGTPTDGLVSHSEAMMKSNDDGVWPDPDPTSVVIHYRPEAGSETWKKDDANPVTRRKGPGRPPTLWMVNWDLLRHLGLLEE